MLCDSRAILLYKMRSSMNLCYIGQVAASHGKLMRYAFSTYVKHVVTDALCLTAWRLFVNSVGLVSQ